MKVKLLTPYLNLNAGSIFETDEGKCQELIKLGRAVLVGEEKKPYENKMMQSKPAVTVGFICQNCQRKFKNKHGLKIHSAKCKK